MTKVGIVGIVEVVLPDESLEIVDVRLPALRIVEQRFGEYGSGDTLVLPPQVSALQAKVAISALCDAQSPKTNPIESSLARSTPMRSWERA